METNGKPIRGFLSAVLVACLFVIPFAASGASSTPPVQEYKLTILHTNDFHGYDPVVLARKATLIKRLRSEAENALVLDAGDIFSRGEYHQVYWGALEMAAMNATGYDAWTLGNNELKCDVDEASTLKHIRDLTLQAKFPTLCGNVFTKDKQYLSGVMPYFIKEVGGLRVGIFGLTNSNKVMSYSQTQGLLVRDAVNTASWLVPQVTAKADIVISLSHASLALDQAMAERVKGISAVVSGDDHQLLDPPLCVNGVPIVQTGGEAEQYLGCLELTYRLKAGKWSLFKYQERLYPIDDSIASDPEVLKIVQEYIRLAEKPAA